MRINILFLLITIFSFSQKNIKGIKVEYKFITNHINGSVVENRAILFAKNKLSMYIVYKNEREISEIKYLEDDNLITKEIDLSNGSSMYMKTNLLNDTIAYTSNIKKVKYLISEKIPKMNWKYEPEEKIINNFICKKATLKFRGREYVAWYSEDIPVHFGPWKFSNLPGLVLEISDLTNTYHWLAIKINTIPLENIIFEIDSSKYKKINLKEYISKIDANAEDFRKIILSKAPKGTIIKGLKVERNSIEKKYEWEN